MNKILSNVVIHKDYSKDIVRVLRSSKSDELIRRKLSKYHENDIADAIKLLDKDTRIRLYKILGVDWTAEIFSYLEDTPEYIEEFMTELSVDEAADVLEKMDADDAVDILDNVSEEERQALLEQIPDGGAITENPQNAIVADNKTKNDGNISLLTEEEQSALQGQDDELKKNEEILNLKMQHSLKLKQEIGSFVDENPQIAAKLIQNWLLTGGGNDGRNRGK